MSNRPHFSLVHIKSINVSFYITDAMKYDHTVIQECCRMIFNCVQQVGTRYWLWKWKICEN